MKSIAKISGRTFLPLSGNPAKGLILLLHGYGGNGSNLFHLLSTLRPQYPDLAIAVPDGPFQLQEKAFAWIRLSFPVREEQLWNGAVQAAPILDEYIDGELKLLGLKEDSLFLIGFSQGSIMALHIGLRQKSAPAAVIAISGFLVGEQHLGLITSPPPVYLISGDQDNIVPPYEVAKTEWNLQNAGLIVHHTLIKGLNHTINQTVIDEVKNILSPFYNR